jgi:hypothetical protein
MENGKSWEQFVSTENLNTEGEPLKYGLNDSKDSFRYRGTMEDNVVPVQPFSVSGEDDSEDNDPVSHRDYTAG